MRGLQPMCGRRGEMLAARVLLVIAIVVVCIGLVYGVYNVAFRLWHRELPQPLPPDLSSCTRIEIQYEPWIGGYPVWSDEAEEIHAFARKIAAGMCIGRGQASFHTKVIATVLCHFAVGPSMRMRVVDDDLLVTEEQQHFTYRMPLGTLTTLSSQVRSSHLLPQVRLRIQCARNLRYL